MEEKTVQLSLGTILRECSLNPQLAADHFYYFSLKNRENVHQVFRYKKFNDDFVDTVTCYRNDDSLIGMVRPSYDEFLKKLLFFLNVPYTGIIQDDDHLTNRLLKRVELLKNIKSEAELKKEFPVLYKDLQDGRKYYNNLQKIRRQEGLGEEQAASGEHYYYGCALKKSLANFVKTQSVLYERFITKRDEFRQLGEKTSYNSYLMKNFDLDKFYMYVVHEYLCYCEIIKDVEEIKKYIILVERYLSSSRKKTVSITTDQGIKVDIDMILMRLHNLKRQISDNSSLVEWVLVPDGKDYSHVKQEKESRRVLMNLDEIKRLQSLGERKRVFYENSPYLAKVLGLKRYRGYIGYIYENGEVLLDREYIANRPSSASGDAIYRMKVIDFEHLSRCDKQRLRKDPRVGRINHTSNWEERAQKIIDIPATEDSKKEAHALVKRLKEKRAY